MNSLKQAINDFLSENHLKEKIDEHALISSWEKIMGKMIAKHTKEIFIKDKILTVKLDSSVLREELAYGKTTLIKLLNNSIGSEVVKDVVLK